MSPVKKKSPIWEYFDILSENSKYAVCLLCGVQISRGGEGKKAGTSAMSNHLRSKHPVNFRLMNLGKAKTSPALNVQPTNFTDPDIPSTSSSTEKLLASSESCERKWEVTDVKTNKYHYLIAEMIALDNEPLSVVQRVGFTRLLQNALPKYEVPSLSYISQKIIPDIYNRIYEKIKSRLLDSVAVSVASDMWTCLHNNSSFLRFRAHWLTSEFQPQYGILAIKPFSGSNSSENIANELNSIIDHWDIEQTKIHILVHDCSVNMASCVQLPDYDSARCFIHSLQRIVTESLKVQPEVTDMFAVGRGLVTHFNHSGLANEKLVAIQKELKLPEYQFVQDISTKWNSIYYMAECLLEQRQAISLYVSKHVRLKNLSLQEWCLMEQCVILLKPFEEITKITSSGLSCISEVIPHIAALKKYLEKDETGHQTADLLQMRASLKTKLDSCFNSIGEDPNYLLATFLDPRFKTDYLSCIEAERARQKILSGYIKMTSDNSSCTSSPAASPTPSKRYKGNESDIFTRNSHNNFWDCFNEVANDNKRRYSSQEKNPIASEIDSYLKTIRIDRTHNPYVWWSVNSFKYPHLSKFARVYLSAPSSSVYSERLFSEASLVYQNKHNLLPANAENLVFIHHNLPLINFEY